MVVRSSSFILRQPGYSIGTRAFIPRYLQTVGIHFGLEALPRTVLDFGTQAGLSVPRLLVVWLYR